MGIRHWAYLEILQRGDVRGSFPGRPFSGSWLNRGNQPPSLTVSLFKIVIILEAIHWEALDKEKRCQLALASLGCREWWVSYGCLRFWW